MGINLNFSIDFYSITSSTNLFLFISFLSHNQYSKALFDFSFLHHCLIMTGTKFLHFYYQNVRGLRTKTNIRSSISASEYDLIAFTEHWLNEDFQSDEYFDDNFFVEREDRSGAGKKWGGGALIAIKRHIAYVRRSEWENELPFENVWIELKSKTNSQKTFINVVYIPPRTKFEQYEKYYDILTEIMCAREPNAKYFIFGDFNMGAAIEWYPYMNECMALSHDGDIANELINTLAITDLKQINFVRNSNNRILDLVLTNCAPDEYLLASAVELSRTDHHHPPIEVKFSAKDLKFITAVKTPKLNFFKANYELINYELDQIDWVKEFDNLGINEQVEKFYTIVNGIIRKFTPTILPRSDDFPKWFSMKLIELIKDKNYFKDKFKQTKIEYFNDIFKTKRKEAKYELRACEKSYTKSIEENIKSNTKAFFCIHKVIE